ncbi:hypothetical protein U1Q18_006520, partial [Sarracenia purpurea var. burkii]
MQQGGKGLRQFNVLNGEEIALIIRRSTNSSLGEGFKPPISEITGISRKGESDRVQSREKQIGEKNTPKNLRKNAEFPSHTLGEGSISFITAQIPNPKIMEAKNRGLETLPSSATMDAKKYTRQSQIWEATFRKLEGTNHGRKSEEGTSGARSPLLFPDTEVGSESHIVATESPNEFPLEISKPSQRIEKEGDSEGNK